VKEAIASATRRSGMTGRIVDRILLPLVDADRRPPGKAKPQSATELANADLDTVVAEALKALADREIVRCSGDPDDPNAPWQLDHDYLARPILRLKREQEKRQVLLAERAKAFSQAGRDLGLRWRGCRNRPACCSRGFAASSAMAMRPAWRLPVFWPAQFRSAFQR
jgi:hypothetical protein